MLNLQHSSPLFHLTFFCLLSCTALRAAIRFFILATSQDTVPARVDSVDVELLRWFFVDRVFAEGVVMEMLI